MPSVPTTVATSMGVPATHGFPLQVCEVIVMPGKTSMLILAGNGDHSVCGLMSTELHRLVDLVFF